MKKTTVIGVLAALTTAALVGLESDNVIQSHTNPSAGTPAPLVGVTAALAQSQNLGPLPPDQLMTITVTTKDVTGAARFLSQNKLTVLRTNVRFGTVTVRGTVHSLETTFGGQLSNWREKTTGARFFADDRIGPLPSPIDGILGLDDYARPQPQTQTDDGLSAYQLEHAYGAASLLSSGTNGTGVTVAIFTLTGFDPANISAFDQGNSLTTRPIVVTRYNSANGQWATITQVAPNPADSQSADQELEAELDIEAVQTMAPQATIHVYEVDKTSQGWAGSQSYLQFAEAVAEDGDDVASISYGECESDFGTDLRQLQSAFSTLASSTAIFASTGDTGKLCWKPGGSFVTEVGYPASDPSVTAVGGTHLDLKDDNSRNAEQAWDNGKDKASGGGLGSTFFRPEWQNGPGLPGGSQRVIPDVAADADAGGSGLLGSGLFHGGSGLRANVYVYADKKNEQTEVGGTSLAAPLWAGIAALYDQAATAHNAPAFTAGTPYRLPVAALSDVTSTQNTGTDLAAPAGPGWDAATGLGTPNAAVIVHDGIAFSSPTISYTDLHTVDWPNVTVPAEACGTNGPVQLHDGKAVADSSRWPGFPQITVVGLPVYGGVAYGDLDGDGHDDAALEVECDTGGFTGGSRLADNEVLYSGVNGPHSIGVVTTLSAAVTSEPAAEFDPSSIRLTLYRLTAVEDYYGPNDPNACPSKSQTDVWSWDGSTFTPATSSPTASSCVAPSPPAATSSPTASSGVAPPPPAGTRPGYDNPEDAVDGFSQGELAGNWAAVCSYVTPSVQSICLLGTSGQGAATGSVHIGNAVVSGAQALVPVTGNICAPSSPCVANSDPGTGMPQSASGFAAAYEAVVSNTSTVMSPVPCTEIGGKWYVVVFG